jgi:2,3-bisphosphoglycerate-dependent phosphoglycerate mutase
MGILILTRHGVTEWNQQKRFTGFTDVPLPDLGVQQAHKVGKQLKELGYTKIDKAYTSWLERSIESLKIILAELGHEGMEFTQHPFLNERHYGSLQGLFHAEMKEKYGEEQVQIWRRSYATRPPNGESLRDVVVRTQFYLNDELMPRVKAGETVLVCAHGNSNRAMVKQLEKISDDEIVKREIAWDEPLIYEIDEKENVKRLL